MTIELTEAEARLLDDYAWAYGLNPDDAASLLVADGLADRVQAVTGQRPSAAVLKFRRTEGGAA